MIRVGIGGWTFAPWRQTFYPKEVKAAGELGYASRHVTTIEINGTFYRTQSAASFAKWREETPEDFVFSVKGHRAIVNAKKLGEAGMRSNGSSRAASSSSDRSWVRCCGSSRRSRSSTVRIYWRS
jgi:uncharacterized protein YecE (DUF72 family)